MTNKIDKRENYLRIEATMEAMAAAEGGEWGWQRRKSLNLGKKK